MCLCQINTLKGSKCLKAQVFLTPDPRPSHAPHFHKNYHWNHMCLEKGSGLFWKSLGSKIRTLSVMRVVRDRRRFNLSLKISLLSQLQPHCLYCRDNSSTYLIELLWWINEKMPVKLLAQYLRPRNGSINRINVSRCDNIFLILEGGHCKVMSSPS